MRIGKKVTGIVLCAFTLLLALLFVILAASTSTSIIDLANDLGSASSYYKDTLGKQLVLEMFRLIACLVLAVFCGVTGGINLGKAIKGRPEAPLNRVVLFVAFDFVGVAAALAFMFTYADTLNSDYIASISAYTVTMLIMIIAISVVSTMARRRALAEGGNKIAAGIMLAVVATLMLTVLIIESLAAPEIVSPRYSGYKNEGTIRDFYTVFEILAYLIGFCGTLAFAVLNIVEGAIAKKRAGKKPVEEKAEEKPAK